MKPNQPNRFDTIVSIVNLILRISAYGIIAASIYFGNSSWTFLPKWLLMGYIACKFIQEARKFHLKLKDKSAIIELLVEIGTQNIEVLYIILDSDGLDILLIHTTLFYVHNFVNQFLFKFPEPDDFTGWTLLVASFTIQSLIHKKLMVLGYGLVVLSIILKFLHIRYTQWVLLNRNVIPTVAIYCSNSITSDGSADLGHLYVRVGQITYEIFKTGHGISCEKIQPQQHSRIREKWYGSDKNFYIPFINYGIVGLVHPECHKDPALAQIIYEGLASDGDYNSSTKSCQEFAMQFAFEVSNADTALKFFSTNLKAVIVPFLFVAIVFVKNVNINLEWK